MYKIWIEVQLFVKRAIAIFIAGLVWYGLYELLSFWLGNVPIALLIIAEVIYLLWMTWFLIELLWGIYHVIGEKREIYRSLIGSASKKCRDSEDSRSQVISFMKVIRDSISWGGIKWINKFLDSLGDGYSIQCRVVMDGKFFAPFTSYTISLVLRHKICGVIVPVYNFEI